MNLQKLCGVYRIYNKVTGRSYIGQSIDINRRLWSHFRGLNNGNHHCKRLQYSFNAHGAEAFERQILEICSPDELTEREQFWIDTAYYMHGIYNLAPAAGSIRGVKFSEESRRRMSEAQKLISHRPLSEEHRRKIGEANRGRKRSEEARQNISKAKTGKKQQPLSEEHRRKISEGTKGRRCSDETKAKIGAATRLRRAKQKDGLSL